jgi:hypothetical protein
VHRRALAREAVAVAEDAAGEHEKDSRDCKFQSLGNTWP